MIDHDGNLIRRRPIRRDQCSAIFYSVLGDDGKYYTTTDRRKKMEQGQLVKIQANVNISTPEDRRDDCANIATSNNGITMLVKGKKYYALDMGEYYLVQQTASNPFCIVVMKDTTVARPSVPLTLVKEVG